MNYTEDFNNSFERNVSTNYDVFFKTFYDRFELKSPQIKALFAHTEISRRYEMLEDSIFMLMECSVRMAPTEEIRRLAKMHAALGVPLDMYDTWLEALIEALKELDNDFTESEEDAWRTVLTPGIRYFRQACD